MRDRINECFENHRNLAEKTRKSLVDGIVSAANEIISSLEKGGKFLLCGNGGSAADAQHIAAEFTGRYLIKGRRALPALALTTDTSALTAIGNDFGFDHIFSRQVQALASSGDILLAISTSGNSPNVLEAIKTAQEIGCRTIGLTGHDGGQMKDLVHCNLVVTSEETPRIQEMHILIGHILCDIVDRHFAD
jgi:D-sedoheptulose 7-phosphate isomerase